MSPVDRSRRNSRRSDSIGFGSGSEAEPLEKVMNSIKAAEASGRRRIPKLPTKKEADHLFPESEQGRGGWEKASSTIPVAARRDFTSAYGPGEGVQP
jgi:hypothetical protein